MCLIISLVHKIPIREIEGNSSEVDSSEVDSSEVDSSEVHFQEIQPIHVGAA